jgi:hypothetical protein
VDNFGWFLLGCARLYGLLDGLRCNGDTGGEAGDRHQFAILLRDRAISWL